METLTKLFGSPAKIKLIKLFIFNPETPFDLKEMSVRIKESVNKIRKETPALEKSRLIKKKIFSKLVQKRKRSKKVTIKKKTHGWILNENFELLVPLQTFLVSANHLSPKEITKKLSKAGTIKLVIVSGVFIHDPESRVDLLVVGDHLKKAQLDNAIKVIESEIGRELRYAVFETTDFMYRLGLYDKLIRDIIDFPHEKVINKLGIG